MVVVAFSSYAQNSISVAGFGEISYVENANGYKVNIGDLGAFDFTGTIQPLNLETKVTSEQLKQFPGYQLVEELELEEMSLKLLSNSLSLEGQANTKKKLKTLCEAFNIQAPFIKFIAQIAPQKMDLKAGMDFMDSPIVIDISKETGTRLILENMELAAVLGYDKTAQPSLAVSNRMKIRPTGQEKDLKTLMKLSYNLMTTEITGEGMMNDTWIDPLGMSNVVGIKKDAVSLSNTAVSLGWIPASPTPTTIGFAVEKGNFFNMEFITVLIVSPLNKEIALKAHRNKMEIKDFMRMLKEGFNLKVPDNLFADDMIFNDVTILFSPNGCKIGNDKIDKGFLYKGGVQFSDAASGDLFFYANSKDSITLDMNTKGFDKILEAKIIKGKEKDTELDKALKQAVATLQVRKIQLHLIADKNLNLVGATECELVVFDKAMNFNIDGAFNPDKITNTIIKKIGKTALEHVAKTKKK